MNFYLQLLALIAAAVTFAWASWDVPGLKFFPLVGSVVTIIELIKMAGGV